MQRRLIDLSHTVEHGMLTYPGLPPPRVSDHMSRAASAGHYGPGTTFHIGRIEMVANTGTYIDAPYHRYADGPDIASLDLACIADLDGVLVDVADGPGRIEADAFAGLDFRGRAVLVYTGWARHWRTPGYFTAHPHLSAAAAECLREGGAALVGIDSLNIDATDDGARPVHTCLLAAGIPIVEHLCSLDRIGAAGFRFSAVPVKVRGLGSFPVRAWAVVCDTRTNPGEQ